MDYRSQYNKNNFNKTYTTKKFRRYCRPLAVVHATGIQSPLQRPNPW